MKSQTMKLDPMKRTLTLIALLMLLSACEEEAAPETEPAATGGEAAGEVLGGTISDDMLPLEDLTSTSPPAEPSPESTTVTTRTQRSDGGQTTVTTTTETFTDADGPEQPEPPATPAAPE